MTGLPIKACLISIALVSSACAPTAEVWTTVDDFETSSDLTGWTNIDVDNQTDPFIPKPQISERRQEADGNHYMLRKPAAEGVVGNRKALGHRALPRPIAVGETATLYARVQVEAFPNNHSFGLTSLDADGIAAENYNAFEPMVRITDKAESDGTKNTGALMVLSDAPKTYANIRNPKTGADAQPLTPGLWYEVWVVVNNSPRAEGGQTYDLAVRGGEFAEITLAYEDAQFRMGREAPLSRIVMISNTGPARAPYGNGGVRYDDFHLAPGRVLSAPESD